MELTERDRDALEVVCKFRFCLGRHIKALAGFSGQRSADRRLKALIEAGFLTRKKYIYGLPYLYTLTHKGRVLLGANKREGKIRVEQITHDIYVLDAVIYFMGKYQFTLRDIESAKELHIKDGFGARKHQPDFVLRGQGKTCAVEVELHPKTKSRLVKNIRDNYLNYDSQLWLTNDSKVWALLESFRAEYPNIKVQRLQEVVKCPGAV